MYNLCLAKNVQYNSVSGKNECGVNIPIIEFISNNCYLKHIKDIVWKTENI